MLQWIALLDITRISPELFACSNAKDTTPPPGLGRRFDRKGNFLPEPGNTVVCHIVEGSKTEQALIEARQRYMAMPEAAKLSLTPLSSLHMTLFQGIIEYRRNQPFWPADVDPETPIDTMTDLFLERLRAFPGGKPFNVRVTDAEPEGLVLEGVTAQDRGELQRWRDALSEVFGYRHPNHDSYVFHITLSYVIERLDASMLPQWQQMLDTLRNDLAARLPVLELRPPAFCAFRDMTHFEELRVLPFG